MGNKLTTGNVSLTLFEIFNEIYITIGGGIFGLAILIHYGIKNNHIISTILLTSVSVGSLVYVFSSINTARPSRHKVVFITGCDSGLGFSMAHHACEMGFTVLAGCLKVESDGGKLLKSLFGHKIRLLEIDITNSSSIEVAVSVIEEFLEVNPRLKLWAVVNNAGIMIFGEFEWLTERLLDQQVAVNLTGTFKLTKALCPLLRQNQPSRLINISSHCGLATLPGLAVYGATKAGLLAWCDGIRVELNKYGVDVVALIPGSFVQHSNIMANQVENCFEMYNSFTSEQKDFYGEYFKRYNSYLSVIGGPKVIRKIHDPFLYTQFERALLDSPPRSLYINEPFTYSMYHMLFKYSPVRIRDYFVTHFMQMPEYRMVRRPNLPAGVA